MSYSHSQYARFLPESFNSTVSSPKRQPKVYNSCQDRELRQYEFPIFYSQLPKTSILKYSSIKTRSFRLPRPQFLVYSNKLPNQSPQKISKEIKKKDMGLFDLEKQFAFYGAYHSNPANVLIHMVFVWPIVFSSLMLLYFTPAIVQLPAALNDYGFLVLNFGFFLTVIYAAFYVALDKKAGSLAALMCFLCWYGSSSLSYNLGSSLAWKVAVAAQLFCWTGQFIGHGVFEKRAPALLDNLSQAFLMAPFFVLLEALQSFTGYEPYPGFHANVKAKIDAEIKDFQEKKQKKLS